MEKKQKKEMEEEEKEEDEEGDELESPTLGTAFVPFCETPPARMKYRLPVQSIPRQYLTGYRVKRRGKEAERI